MLLNIQERHVLRNQLKNGGVLAGPESVTTFDFGIQNCSLDSNAIVTTTNGSAKWKGNPLKWLSSRIFVWR